MTINRGRIVVVGGMNMDIVVEAKEMPGIGEYAYGDALHFIHGGNGLNQAVAAARLGSNVEMIGFIGDDAFGKDLVQFLKKEHVNSRNVKTIINTNSGSVLFLLTNKVERHIVLPGSNLKAGVKDLPKYEFLKSDIVISQLTIQQDVIEHVFGDAKKAGATTILNLFPNYDVTKKVLELSDYIILNEVELAFRTGDKEFINSQHKDLQMDNAAVLRRVKQFRTNDKQTFIVTLAERGVIGIKGNGITKIDGIKVKFADATGAGDCFLGAFATGLAEKMPFNTALGFANCAAALSVQKVGTTTSFPRREDVENLAKRQ